MHQGTARPPGLGTSAGISGFSPDNRGSSPPPDTYRAPRLCRSRAWGAFSFPEIGLCDTWLILQCLSLVDPQTLGVHYVLALITSRVPRKSRNGVTVACQTVLLGRW